MFLVSSLLILFSAARRADADDFFIAAAPRKSIPQGLKPTFICGIYVRAEARTLHRVDSSPTCLAGRAGMWRFIPDTSAELLRVFGGEGLAGGVWRRVR